MFREGCFTRNDKDKLFTSFVTTPSNLLNEFNYVHLFPTLVLRLGPETPCVDHKEDGGSVVLLVSKWLRSVIPVFDTRFLPRSPTPPAKTFVPFLV